ncbi:MAG: CNNM domain-containing protein, partial [Pyrinomonadaceae bacterium]
MWFETGITFLLSIGMAFLATIDISFSQLSDVGLRLLRGEAEERSSSTTKIINEVLNDRSGFRFILSASIQVLQVAITVLITFISLQLLPNSRFILLAFVAGYAMVILFRQFIPRLIVSHSPERTILVLLPVFSPAYKLIVWVARPWHALFDRLVGSKNEADWPDKETEEEEDGADVDLQALIDVGEEEGIIEEKEGEMIHTIIEFGDTRVSEIMTPRTEIVALPVTSTVRQARDLILESKYSRIPIYEEHIDNFRGLV